MDLHHDHHNPDMRYETPGYFTKDTGVADLISGERLQLVISRGSAKQVIDGFGYFGYYPAERETNAGTVSVTLPHQLGGDYNATQMENIMKYVAPELEWKS